MAAARATRACSRVAFSGAQFRRDIAHKGIARTLLQRGRLTYKQAGVDISAGNSLVERIKPAVATTCRAGLMGGLGGFGGLFDTAAAGYKDPLLVSGTDGVGTKIKVAHECGVHGSVGIDLVAMCVNDILAHAAEPLFFLDYFACGALDVRTAAQVVEGVAEGCRQAGCALVGGETAEMPGLYEAGDYDLAGFAVGAVERSQLLPRTERIATGDVVLGLPSSGLHSNGFSLARRVMRECGAQLRDPAPFAPGRTIGEELLTPTRIYVRSLLKALRSGRIKAMAHITGGGLTENIPRVLPPGTTVRLDARHWPVLPVFAWMAVMGGISSPELLRTFNCGIGAVLIVSPADKDAVLADIPDKSGLVIGVVEVQKGAGDGPRVYVDHFEAVMDTAMRPYIAPLVASLAPERKRVGVLISGSGTNLQALIDTTTDLTQGMGAEIVLVISNKPGVEGLKRAERANIPTQVIRHTAYESRQQFDTAMHAALTAARVDIVCLAGFMRILTGEFVRLWRGRLINIHPSLLPSFKGPDAHRLVLEAGVRVSGCTAHFVEEDIDAGAILAQEAVPVEISDTEKSLQERVKHAEHKVFPRALRLVATGQVVLKDDNTLEWKP